MVLHALHRSLVGLSHIERRIEPFIRPPLDAVFRAPQAALIQFLLNLGRRNEGLGLAEERLLPDEETAIRSIMESAGMAD